jgi:hypothetical protein
VVATAAQGTIWFGSARLGQSEQMQGVLDRYTRHFFAYAHCIVVQVQPPRGLHITMKEWQKQQQQQQTAPMATIIKQVEYSLDDAVQADLTNPNLTPLEKLHMVQSRIQESSTGNHLPAAILPLPMANLGKCTPGEIDFLRAFWRPFDAAMPLGLCTAVAVVPPEARHLVT